LMSKLRNSSKRLMISRQSMMNSRRCFLRLKKENCQMTLRCQRQLRPVKLP
jgi:hypothetical protein